MEDGLREAQWEGGVRYMEATGVTYPGPSYRCNGSIQWMEGWERICFHIDCNPGGWCQCFTGGGVQRNVRRDGTGCRN